MDGSTALKVERGFLLVLIVCVGVLVMSGGAGQDEFAYESLSVQVLSDGGMSAYTERSHSRQRQVQ